MGLVAPAIDLDCHPGEKRTRGLASLVRSSLEKIGRRAGGVPFTEGNFAVPALVHGFLERLKRFGSVLGFVALESAFESLKVFRRVGDGNGEVCGIGGVKRERRGPDEVERLGLGGERPG